MGDTWGAGQSFSYAASGFTPGSTNVYRVFATNDAHSAWSGIRSFTNYNTITVATLPLDAGEINVASATLRGEVTDTGGMVPYAGFEWWPTGGSVTSSVSLGLQSGAFDELVFGLARDTEYTFRVWASNAVAGRVVSAPAVFTTLDADFRTLTWNGSASSDWFDPANWDDAAGVAPTTDDIIVINSGSVLLTNETAILKSLTLGNATLTFSNWTTRLTAETVEIGSGGNMTTAGAFGYPSAMSNRVHIVADSLFVKTGGQINVDSKGYRVANGPAKGYQSGSNFNAGGGHGGRGGDEQGGPGGPEWGVPETPVWPGSGGGQYLSDAGGNGGGVVRIEGGTVTINGTISANGQNGSTYNGGGAGGAIWITCHTFVGTNGIIRANGGNGGSAYGGGGAGGGRIAVDYQNITGECSVLFSTKAGLLFSTIPAGVGTLWLPDTTLIDDGLDTRFDHVRLIVPGWTSFSVGDLDLNGLTVAFGEEGFHLTVTNNLSVRNNGSLVVGGKAIVTRSLMPDSVIPASTNVTVNVGGNVWIEGGSLIVGGQWQSGFSYLNVAGDLTLTNAAANAGRLLVGAGITNTTDLVGGSVNITGAFTITSNAWYHPYSHPTNGGSVRLQSASLTVAAGGGVDVNIAGFQSYANIAYGPGFGKSSGSRGGGGGYGGAGGRGADGNSHGGGVYGETNRPLHAGSAGGFGHSPQPGYGHGGGYVRIETGPLVLNGTMTANGRNAISTYGGGGSGGGVFILCDSFEGSASGLVSARGGNGGGVSGGGGGGRVAMAIGMSPADRTKLIDGDEVDGLFVYSTHGPFLGTVSVTNGTTPAGYTPLPEPGTAVFMTVAAGTFSLVVEGNPGAYGTPQPMNYGTTIGITADSILTNSVVTPANEANGLRRACIGWDLADESENPVDSDVTAQAVFTLSANRILTWNWTNEYELVVEAGPNGSVNNGTVDGWYTNQVEVASITATADGGFRFIGWIGDVPVADLTNNPLTLVMDQPRTIQAEFGSISGQFKTWTGNGTWSDFGNWDPPGAPGPNDTITIASGNLLLPAARTVKSAMVNSGATVVFTNWSTALTAGQDVTIAGTVTLPPPFRYDTEMSNRVWIICRDFTLAEGGLINVDAKGYFTHTGPGSTTGGHSNRGSGAGHGGKGGDSPTIVGGVIYGITNAPVMPGSGGGGSYDNAAGHGGGTVWIDATRNVVVDGTISANGGGGGTYNGGGSGGSIFIVAGNSFAGAATGIIRANGGNRGSGYSALGGGGGGRVAVWHQPVDPADRVILMEGGEVKRMEIHGTLPTYLGMATANAATLSNDPPGDGTVIFLRVAPPAGTVFLIR